MRRCPDCRSELERSESAADMEVDVCRYCGGWFLNSGLAEWQDLQEKLPGIDYGEQSSAPGRMCPNDGSELDEHCLPKLGKATFCRCSTCLVTWIRRDELKAFGAMARNADSPLLSAARLIAERTTELKSPAFDPVGLKEWVDTRADIAFVGIIASPLIPIGIVIGKLVDGSEGDVPTWVLPLFWALGVVVVAYCVVWIISRIRGQRRLGIGASRLLLPATRLHLTSRIVPHEDVVSVERFGTRERYIRIRFKGGSRVYDHNIVDVALLEKGLSRHVPSLSGEP